MNRDLAGICASLDVSIIGPTVSRAPGTTKCARTLQRILERRGEGHLVLLLRTIMESENNRMALVEPVLWGVSDVMIANPCWPDRGLEWLDAFDTIDLCAIWGDAKCANGAPPERHGISARITELLRARFGEGERRLL